MNPFNERERSKEWYQKNRERKIRQSAEYKKLHPESSHQTYRNLKTVVLSHYSKGIPRCTICGETELDLLSLDHINDDGKIHRKEQGIVAGTQTYYWVKRNHYPPIFQVLCMNCNVAKGNKAFIPKMRFNALLSEYDVKFIGKCKAGPPSDYQDLWFLTKEFRDKIKELLK